MSIKYGSSFKISQQRWSFNRIFDYPFTLTNKIWIFIQFFSKRFYHLYNISYQILKHTHSAHKDCLLFVCVYVYVYVCIVGQQSFI